MNGCIFKRKNKYYGIYYTGRVINGKHEQKWTKGYKYKKDCKAALREIITKLTDNPTLSGGYVTLGSYLLNWIENYSATKQLAENTYNGYMVNIKNHIIPVLGSKRLNELTADDMDILLADMRLKHLSGTSQRYVIATLRKALNTALKRRIIEYNVVNYIDIPSKNKYEPVTLNQKQFSLFKNSLDKLDISYSLPLYILLYLGLRRGEMLGLKWSDFDFNENIVHIQRTATPAKGGYSFSDCKTAKSRRFLKLPSALVDKLLLWKSVQLNFKLENSNFIDFVLCQSNGKILCANTLNSHFKKLLSDCELPNIRIHDLRHSWASLLAVNNVPIKVTSEMLGHSDIQTTLNIYTHANIDMQNSAIGVLDII